MEGKLADLLAKKRLEQEAYEEAEDGLHVSAGSCRNDVDRVKR